MEIKKTEIYICSYCGEEFDANEREKCLRHESAHKKEFISMAKNLKKMCEQIRAKDPSCKICSFNCANKCLLLSDTAPNDWKLYCIIE